SGQEQTIIALYAELTGAISKGGVGVAATSIEIHLWLAKGRLILGFRWRLGRTRCGELAVKAQAVVKAALEIECGQPPTAGARMGLALSSISSRVSRVSRARFCPYEK